LNMAVKRVKKDPWILLENMAGQRNSMGANFPDIREIINGVKKKDRLGVCLDTCHSYAAGMDLHTEKGVAQSLTCFDHAIGVDKARKDDPTALQEISDSTDGDPFRVLIATVLSHRTKDPVTALASSRLFARFPNVKSLAAANTRTVARLIKPVGFYNTKARTVKKISRILLDKYAGKVPENMDQLLELPSVGRKTANCVFVYGFKTPAIP